MNMNEESSVYSATTEPQTGGDEGDLHPTRNICGCKPRLGLFIAGMMELALGAVGLGLIVLGPQKRHVVLHPLEDRHEVRVSSEEWEDTIQLLIEFWLPSLAYFVLGAVLILAVMMRRISVLVSWILISTLLLAGSCAGILALLVAGANVVGLLPLILATVMQMYLYFVISDMTYYHWELKENGRRVEEDKQVLVNSIV